MTAVLQQPAAQTGGTSGGIDATRATLVFTPAYLQARKTAFRRKKAGFGVFTELGRLIVG
jgi:hypothetical protein